MYNGAFVVNNFFTIFALFGENCSKRCGKACCDVVHSLRKKLRETVVFVVRYVRFCGKLFGFVGLCSVFVDKKICFSGKLAQIRTVKNSRKSIFSTDTITIITNINEIFEK